MHVLIKITCGK